MVLRQLRISGEDFFSGLPCSEFFKDEVDRDASAFEARLPHHHIRLDFDVLGQFHNQTLAAILNSLKNCRSDRPLGSERSCAAFVQLVQCEVSHCLLP